jgi:type IV secretory pathway VirB4 component
MPFDAPGALSSLADALGYGGAGEIRPEPWLPLVDHAGTPGTVLLGDGSVLAMLHCRPPSFALLGEHARASHIVRHRAALNALADSNAEVFEWLVRHEGVPPLPPRPPERTPFAARFLRDWHRAVQAEARVNDWFVGILVRPRRTPFATAAHHLRTAAQAAAAQAGRILGRGAPPPPEEVDPDLLSQLEDGARLAMGLLRHLSPRRLGLRYEGPPHDPDRLAFSEVAEALALVRTTQRIPQPLVEPPGTLGAALAVDDAACHRKGFALAWDDNEASASHGRMYGISQYPENLWPDRLDDLLRLPGRFVMTSHYRFFNRHEAQEDMQFLLKVASKDANPALGDEAEIDQAIHRVATGKSVRGRSRWSLAVHADGDPSDDPKAVERTARRRVESLAGQARTVLNNAGLKIVPETAGNRNSYGGQTPAAPRRTFIRPAKLDTEYICALSPLSGHATGPETDPWGHSRRLLTEGDTPFDMAGGVGGVRHMVVLGPNGGGKTVWLAQDIVSNDALVREPHPRRPPGMQFVIDMDESNAQTILALDGAYTAIRGGGEDSGVAPWRLPDGRRLRSMLRAFIPGLCLLAGAKEVTDRDARDIRDGVDFLMECLSPEDRHLGVVRRFMSFEPGGAGGYLERWCREFEGDLAWAFDGTVHSLVFDGPLVGVDLTGVKDDEPVMAAMGNLLLWLASERMDGRRFVLVAEEAPAYIGRPEFGTMGKSLALRARKRNVAFVVVAQQAEHLLATEAGKAIVKQARQYVLFPNDGAEWAVHGPEGLNVPPPVFDLVKGKLLELGQHAAVVFRKDGQSAVVRTDLSHLPDYLRVFSGTTNSVRLMREIWAEWADRPIEARLEEFHRRYHEAAA